jgi:hypothetical protein
MEMLWINSCAVFCLVLGLASGWRLIRKRRLPFVAGDAILSWQENPASMFAQDRLAGASVTFHAFAIVTLACLMLFSVNRSAPSPLSSEFQSPTQEWLRRTVGVDDPQMKSLSMVAAVLAAGIAAFTLGTLAAFPLACRFVRPITVHIVPDGLIYGNTFTAWQEIAHWQTDERRRLIRMFSKMPPGALAVILHPADDGLFKNVEEKIRSVLPDPENDLGWREPRKRLIFGLVFFPSIIIILASAFWVYSFRGEWVWFLYGLEIVALEMGGKYLTRL